MRPDAEWLNGQLAQAKVNFLHHQRATRELASPLLRRLREIRKLWLDDYYELYRTHFYGESTERLLKFLANPHSTTKNVPVELPGDYLPTLGKQEGSKEAWFKYLYTELPPQVQQEVYFKAFDIFGLPLSLDAFIPVDDDLLQLLTRMLQAGLRPYDRLDDGLTLVRDSSINRYLHAHGHQRLPIAFRGETRSPTQKREIDRGSRAKVLIQKFRDDLNMMKAWNPFKADDVRQQCYFRRNNEDNCLYTAVSIAPEFEDASKFPLIQDPFTKKCGRARMRRADNTFVDNVAISLTYVYLFRFGNGYNTQAWQRETYNERATRDVPYTDFLAWAPVLRFHYNEDSGNYGHLAWLPRRADDRIPGQMPVWLVAPQRQPPALADVVPRFSEVGFIDCANDVVPEQQRFNRICSIEWTKELTPTFQDNRVANYAALRNVRDLDVVTQTLVE